MSISDNTKLAAEIEKALEESLPIKLGPNKRNELVRLLYEISRRDEVSAEEAFRRAGMTDLLEGGKGGVFARVKTRLLEMRYPSMRPGDKVSLLPLSFGPASGYDREVVPGISPKRIFVEKSVKNAAWTGSFLKGFPAAEIVTINDIKEAAAVRGKRISAGLRDRASDDIFVVKSKAAFVKSCPCTKKYKRCGYWILNLGFGCPFDCAYCYLQLYGNAPGIILPANVEDYFPHLESMDQKAVKGTRIGTGEFSDSLALEMHTRYSSALIPFFGKMRNLVLELKTKTARIDGVLEMEPNPNVVISWSMNTPFLAERYEKGAASIRERIEAAEKAAAKGYRVGFHFDPIIHYSGWEKDYKAVVEEMFADEKVRRNTAWISLGTLRYTPGLKEAAEKRCSDDLLFYSGEFFADSDGKLRYHREQREAMYRDMAGWIRSRGVGAWIYLCMEPEEIWRSSGVDQQKIP